MPPSARLIIWDVSHGLAVYLRTPNGRHVVIDLGTGSHRSDEGFSPLTHLQERWGVDQIDLLIVTHPHIDHLDDILNLDEAMAPDVFIRPRLISNRNLLSGIRESQKPKMLRYLELCGEYSTAIRAGTSSDPYTPTHWGGMKIQTFIPNPASGNINNHSVVSVLEYAGSKIVIPGDNEAPSWESLKNRPGFLGAIRGADILVAPHHGRESGWDREIVSLIAPSLTVISDKPAGTSAVSKYSNASSGWNVRAGGEMVGRKCLTTRTDGWIMIELGYNDRPRKPYREVRIEG
jgi:beta-lactamase superfamily II metal-dependent hydrolase